MIHYACGGDCRVHVAAVAECTRQPPSPALDLALHMSSCGVIIIVVRLLSSHPRHALHTNPSPSPPTRPPSSTYQPRTRAQAWLDQTQIQHAAYLIQTIPQFSLNHYNTFAPMIPIQLCISKPDVSSAVTLRSANRTGGRRTLRADRVA